MDNPCCADQNCTGVLRLWASRDTTSPPRFGIIMDNLGDGKVKFNVQNSRFDLNQVIKGNQGSTFRTQPFAFGEML